MYRVSTVDGLVLHPRLSFYEACAFSKKQTRKRKLGTLVVRNSDDIVLRIQTPDFESDRKLWLRICKAQPLDENGPIKRNKAHSKRGGISDCEHDWENFNGNDFKCTKCSAWGWRLVRMNYGRGVSSQRYPVIARVCGRHPCRVAAKHKVTHNVCTEFYCDEHVR